MELAYIFYKELPIDGKNIYTANLSEKASCRGYRLKDPVNMLQLRFLLLLTKIYSLIEVTDRNRKKILQELIESLLKEEKRINMLIALNFTTPKAMKKLSL